MKRLLATALLAGSALTAGCSNTVAYEVVLEASGTGRAALISYTLAGGQTVVERDQALPWRMPNVLDKLGTLSFEITPAPGSAAQCKITVEGKEVAAVSAPASQPARCEGNITQDPDS